MFVNHRAAARVLDFANGIFGMIVRSLVQPFGNTGPNAAREQSEQLAIAIGSCTTRVARERRSPACPHPVTPRA